jgi:nanoRNase/pAp phosphatase (c-di-AMP/oligoRNAs hydrolase)
MEKSSEGPKTSDHFLRELIEKARVYEKRMSVFSYSDTERKELNDTIDQAEAYLNRKPEEG